MPSRIRPASIMHPSSATALFLSFIVPSQNAQAPVQGAGASERNLHVDCASNLVDQAGGTCDVKASTVPTEGMLFPLGVELFVDAPTGRVGVGTLAPAEALDVQGRVRAVAGIRFGDDTVQTTAQLAGPQGPQGPRGAPGPQGPQGLQGPPGPLVPPPPLTSIGTFDLTALGCSMTPVPIYSLTWEVASSPNQLTVEKDFDACSPALILMCNQSTVLPGISITIGDLAISLDGARIESVEIQELTDGLPREEVRLTWQKATWEYSGPGGATMASWDLGAGSGSVAPGIVSDPHFAWFGGQADPSTLPAQALEVREVGFAKDSNGPGTTAFADLRVRKPIDRLTTQFPYQAFAGVSLASVTADLSTEPGASYQPYMRYELTNASVTRTSFLRGENGQVLQEVSFGYEIVRWTFHPGRPDQTESFWNLVTNMGG